MTRKQARAYSLLLLVSIIWGIATPVIKNTLQFYSPLVFLTYRFFLSSLVGLFYFALFPSTLPNTRYTVYHSIIHSVCVVILGLGLLFIGINYTDALTGALLTAIAPVFTVTLGSLLLKEKISRHELIGLIITIIGSLLTVFTGDGALKLGFLGAAIIGNSLVLLSRISDAYGSVSTKQAVNHGMSAAALTHISFFLGFLFFAVITMLQLGGAAPLIQTIVRAPLSAHLGVFYMAFISGTLGYTLANHALKSTDLGEASIFTYLTVVWAVPLSIFWLHDKLTPQFVMGACLIGLGVIVAEWKKKKRVKKKLKRR